MSTASTGPKTEVTNGDEANWTVYSFNYNAGSTYHVDDSYGLDSDFDEVPITAPQFIAKDATVVSIKSLHRHGHTVTVSGTTRQFVPTADYGLGATVPHSERAVVQRKLKGTWVTVKTIRSDTTGVLDTQFTATATHTYRVEVSSTRTVAGTTSRPRRR
jgi:hypothetical protein